MPRYLLLLKFLLNFKSIDKTQKVKKKINKDQNPQQRLNKKTALTLTSVSRAQSQSVAEQTKDTSTKYNKLKKHFLYSLHTFKRSFFTHSFRLSNLATTNSNDAFVLYFHV